MTRHKNNGTTGHNSTYQKLAVQYSADTFEVNQTLALRINICRGNPPPSPSAKPLPASVKTDTTQQKINRKTRKSKPF